MTTADKLSLVDILTLILAIWGAVLSTLLGILKIQQEKPHIKVRCWIGTEGLTAPVVDWWDVLIVEAINIGHRPITIVAGGIRLKNGKVLLIQQEGFSPTFSFEPKTLQDGERITITFDPTLHPIFIKVTNDKNIHRAKAFVQEASGKEYTTKISKDCVNLLLSLKVPDVKIE